MMLGQMLRHAVGAAAILTLAIASAGPAAAQRPRSGLLTCDVSGGIGLIIASRKQVSCVYAPDLPGPQDFYVGSFTRFGLDIGDEPSLDAQQRVEVWNDLRWQDITPAVSEGSYIQITAQTQTITANQPLEPEDAEKTEQQQEDGNIMWHQDMSSAELAYILYQVPVLVAVHAAEMLPRD